MMTLRQFTQRPPAIPAATARYLADVALDRFLDKSGLPAMSVREFVLLHADEFGGRRS
jgi:hypothetical protein